MIRKYDVIIFSISFFSFLLSVYLWFGGNKEAGLYVGIWVPSLIAIGIYGKLIRIVHFVLYKYLRKK